MPFSSYRSCNPIRIPIFDKKLRNSCTHVTHLIKKVFPSKMLLKNKLLIILSDLSIIYLTANENKTKHMFIVLIMQSASKYGMNNC